MRPPWARDPVAISSFCEGKEKFLTRDLAQQVQNRRRRTGKHGVTYKCPHCGSWHIGSNSKKGAP